jgi:hypothetical protein
VAAFYWLIESQFKGSASSQWQDLSFGSTSLPCLHDGVSRKNANCIDCDSIRGRYVEVWRYGDCYLGCSKATINSAVCYVNGRVATRNITMYVQTLLCRFWFSFLRTTKTTSFYSDRRKKCLNLLYCNLIFFIFMQERKNMLKCGDKLRTTYLFYS